MNDLRGEDGARRRLIELIGATSDASDASRSDAQWGSLYARARQEGLLSGFGRWRLSVLRPMSDSDLEREVGLPASALRPLRPGAERNPLVSQWALCLQWLVTGVAAYATIRGSAELGGLVTREAHCWALFALAMEHTLFGSPLTRAAVSALNGEYERKLASHEAGHLLAAYLLGLPVCGYRLLGPVSLPQTTFFHPQLSLQQSAGHGITDETLAQLAVVLMSGLAAESLDYGFAEGGVADEQMLADIALRYRPEWSGRADQSGSVWDSPGQSGSRLAQLEQWSSCEAVLLLRENRDAHIRLAAAMRRRAPLGECLAVISQAVGAGCVEVEVDAARVLGGRGALPDQGRPDRPGLGAPPAQPLPLSARYE